MHGGDLKFLIDITDTSRGNVNTGIQRVARQLGAGLSSVDLPGIQFVPIEIGTKMKLQPIRSALEASFSNDYDPRFTNFGEVLRRTWVRCSSSPVVGKFFTLRSISNLGARFGLWFRIKSDKSVPESVPITDFNYLLIADAFWNHYDSINLAKKARRNGLRVGFICFDLLPIEHPEFFDNDLVLKFKNSYSEILTFADDVWAISESTAESFRRAFPIESAVLKVNVFKLGSDVPKNDFVNQNKENAYAPQHVTDAGREKAIMVGTIEPRKNHDIVLDWFERFGFEFCDLDVVGRPGWKSKEVLSRMRAMEERYPGKFVWHDDASDNDLHQIAKSSTVGIIASHAEGFGLPLVEFMNLGIPVVASDIPIFREIGKNSVIYFDKSSSDSLNEAILETKTLKNKGAFEGLLTWQEACEVLAVQLASQR